MSIKKLTKFFKKAPIEEVTEKLQEVGVEFIPNEKEEKKEYSNELKNLNELLKILKHQLNKKDFSELPKNDLIRCRISKEEKEYLKQFCIDNNIEGGISELIRLSIDTFICRKEIEDGKE